MFLEQGLKRIRATFVIYLLFGSGWEGGWCDGPPIQPFGRRAPT